MEQGDIPSDDTPSRAKVMSFSILLGDDTIVGGVLETMEVSDQGALAEEAAASAVVVVGSGGDDGDDAVLAGYGQETETPGAVESRDGAEVLGRSKVATGVEERITEGHGSGGLDQVVEEAGTSTAREPRTDLGKTPIVEGEPEVEPMVEDIPPTFVGSGAGAGSSRHIGVGDYLATASMEDVLELVRGYPRLADALLASREAELEAELRTEGVRESEAEERADERPGGWWLVLL
ncbi:hypothetical protein RHMOL_Rhmol06G0171400 [Rhododendron molle]|uniref:Uncharacterized protein n=1 Tax=Rhododendron molle TaxID=49168 RepID=A0ACC0NFI9_RHOML|nr:hypothetical protein RHMOL_Rhmol06G0171400 [Rhododendron molle]